MIFSYLHIGETELERIARQVSDGVSAVFLGARHAGRRYATDRLRQLVTSFGIGPIVELRRDRAGQIGTLGGLAMALTSAVSDDGEEQIPVADSPFEPIDRLAKRVNQPVWLFASDVDSMAPHIARQFLRGVRTRVNDKSLVVVLGGEYDFRDLVWGPNSEFNCANQVVVQGLSRDAVLAHVTKYLAAIPMLVCSPDEIAEWLWNFAGGNLYLVKGIWGIFIEDILNVSSSGQFVIEGEYLHNLEMRITEAEPERLDALRFAEPLISRSREVLGDLERLLETDRLDVSRSQGAPTALELSGLAVRIGTEVRFSSPVAKSFAMRRYTNRQLGDLYARLGDWESAFSRYARIDPEDLIRPAGANDRVDVESAITSLEAALHAESVRGETGVKDLFARGCRLILGFRNVTFWQRDRTWALDEFSRAEGLPDGIADALRTVLPSAHTSPGWISLPEQSSQFAVAGITKTIRPDRDGAVVISDGEGGASISRDRERLARRLIGHLVEAQGQAVEIERNKRRLHARNQHVEIVASIVDALGTEVSDVRHLVAMAARGLKDLGYGRVLFALTDPQRTRIQGILDISDDASVDLARMLDYALDNPLADLHPYVVSTGKAVIVPDPQLEPLVNIAATAASRPIAVVPMISGTRGVIGTVHVERRDGGVPTTEEVDDLLLFGRQLSTAIEQTERIQMLKSALDRMPGPVLIVDQHKQVVYANEPASSVFGAKVGWTQTSSGAASPTSGVSGDIEQFIRASFESDGAISRRVSSVGKQQGAAELFVDRITDWKGRPIGVVLFVDDRRQIEGLLMSMRRIAEAGSTTAIETRLVEACLALGYSWARLYRLRQSDTQTIMRGSVGLPRDIAGFDLTRTDPNDPSWQSIDTKRTYLFCLLPEQPQGSRRVTASGLEALTIAWPNVEEALGKRPGEFWLDIPLTDGDRAFGKLTVGCSELVHADQIATLEALVGNATALIRSSESRDRIEELTRISTSDASTATVVHNIISRLSALPVILARYRQRERSFPDLKELNDTLQSVLSETLEVGIRFKEMFAAGEVKVSRFDLVEHIQRTLARYLEPSAFDVTSSEGALYLRGDAQLLEAAIIELIQNARSATGGTTDRLRLMVSIKPSGRANERIQIRFADNGPGISADLKPRIFDSFVSNWPGRRSTGLGLGFVRRILQAHGGFITEVGGPTTGAVFVLDLPNDGRPIHEMSQPKL